MGDKTHVVNGMAITAEMAVEVLFVLASARNAEGYVLTDTSLATGFVAILAPVTETQTKVGTRAAKGEPGKPGFEPAEAFDVTGLVPLCDERMDRWGFEMLPEALAAAGFTSCRWKLGGNLKREAADAKPKAKTVVTRQSLGSGKPTLAEKIANKALADAAATARLGGVEAGDADEDQDAAAAG